jgi:hypothetical protein
MPKQSKKTRKHLQPQPLQPQPKAAAETVKNPKKTSPMKFLGKSW